ncbi:hypothetical protein [Caviibacterium pharyngocola]|uniref:Adhesin n=1 Tax=Caviibacterium pharyngocola TaxID=28159 RepID=A0A2M8RV64_9PAST|nr:hypothetical protein [Caviibacterium pharyngocola]PJG82788.1 hypothetical protein CVP04_07440 [Caviibacterium pharyngocola]
MRKLTIFALTALCVTPVLAASNDVIFSCTAINGSPIEVKKVGNDYQFKYGKTVFKNAIKDVLQNPNSYIATGSGFITSSLALRNKGYSYIIQFIQPRNAPINIDDPNLYIEKDDNMQTVKCDTSKSIFQKFDVKAMRPGP